MITPSGSLASTRRGFALAESTVKVSGPPIPPTLLETLLTGVPFFAESQNKRGGGTACTSSLPAVQALLYQAVVDVDPCGQGAVTPKGSSPPK